MPFCFIGSPRNQMQSTQDTIAIVSQIGKLYLFITVTCIPKCPEIMGSIPQAHAANNHPMLVNMIFKKKLPNVIEYFWKRQFFSIQLDYLYIIQFPAYLFFTLRDQDELSGSYIIDYLIYVEILDVENVPGVLRTSKNSDGSRMFGYV